jgi:hypothetical protein
LTEEHRFTRTRVLAIVVLGLAAVGAALVAAHGPARSEQAVYSWPPTRLPSAEPTRTWFTPLLVARREVEQLDAQVPCGDRRALTGAGKPLLVLGTARDRVQWNGLEVTRSTRPSASIVRVGNNELARLPLDGAGCSFRLRISGLEWSIARGGDDITRGTLASPVGVTGLFTQLDLRDEPGLHVTVRPYPQDTRPSNRQLSFQILGVLLVVAALLTALWFRPRPVVRVPRVSASAQDVAVALCLAAYWVLAPLQDDDGWVRARQTNSLVSGGFSSYFQHLGVDLPSITWFEWLQRPAVAHTGSLVINRIPTIAILAATWLVCRACLVRLLGRGPNRRDAAWWSAAAVFSLGAAAFGVTLRPEPPIALLGAGVLACCVRYAIAPGVPPLVGAVLLSGSAVAIHPSGVTAASPLVVCLPRVYSDMRKRVGPSPFVLVGITLIGLAWALLLLFVDSDFANRKESTQVMTAADPSESQSPLNEIDRYRRLLDLGGTPLRREFVALLLLAVVCLVVGRFWRRSLSQALPSASLAIALIFLLITPSKWIWHFGTLIGICAVAVGVEAHHLAVGRRSIGLRWIAAIVLLGSGLWAARGSFQWTTFRTGNPSAWNDVPYVPILLVASVAAVVVAALSRRNRSFLRPELVLVLVVVVALVGTTTVALAVDARHPGWTAARQAVSSLTGSRSCGMATGLTVASPGSIRPLTAAGRLPTAPSQTTQPRGPESERARVDAPSSWFRVPKTDIGLLVDMRTWNADDELVVTWGRGQGRDIRPIASGVVQGAADSGLAPARRVLVDQTALPKRPANATFVRVDARTRGSHSAVAPQVQLVSFESTALQSRMRKAGFKTLVTPYLLEGVPCVTIPPLDYGVAGVPDLIVEGDLWPAAVGGASPFAGVADVYDLLRVPVANWPSDRGLLYVYWVVGDRRDAVAPATRRVGES